METTTVEEKVEPVVPVIEDTTPEDTTDQFYQIKKDYSETQAVRRKLKDRLAGIIDAISIAPDAKASQIEAQMGIVNSLSGILNDMDGQSTTFEKLKIAKKDTDINASSNKLIAEFLYKLNPSSVNVTIDNTKNVSEEIDTEIETALEERGESVSDGEVE